MNRSFPCKLVTFALFLLAASPALACPRLLRGIWDTQGAAALSPVVPSASDGPNVGRKAEPAIPEALEPPKDQVLLFSLRAEGTQVYECRAKKDNATHFEWALKAPDAILFDDLGQQAGTHTAGPAWEGTDGSKVVAVKQASSTAPGGRAIAWLLLRVQSHQGTGAFSKVTYIQRVDTWAGLPPEQGMNRENAEKQVRIKYEATYRFFGPMPQK